MIPSIARQSVIIKCNMQKSILTGNYEFYYAAGLVNQLFGLELDADSKPQDLKALFDERLSRLEGQDEKEAYLLQLLLEYKPSEEYDKQMKELFLWGKEEKFLWEVFPPV